MTVKISKPAINVREELADLKKPTGIAGEAMLRAETPQEQFNLIGAGRRNLLINGAMQVAQRDTSVTSISGSAYFTVDRWHTSESGTGAELRTTQSQSADAPDGFGSSCKIQVTTPISTITDGYWRLINRLEGLNLQSLNHGSINAKSVTASFWVKSSIASTYSVMMYKPDTGRNIGSTYTINSANTWEYKTITIPGDTVGAIHNNTGEGMYLSFNLFGGTSFVGADNTSWASYSGQRLANGHNANAVVTTNGATFQITGVQLELGKVATPFEHRSYGEELALCHRYFQKLFCSGSSTRQMIGAGHYNTSTALVIGYQHYGGVMRANPTGTFSALNLFDLEPFDSTPTAISIDVPTNKGCFINCTDGTSRTTGFAGSLFLDTDGAFIAFDAEL